MKEETAERANVYRRVHNYAATKRRQGKGVVSIVVVVVGADDGGRGNGAYQRTRSARALVCNGGRCRARRVRLAALLCFAATGRRQRRRRRQRLLAAAAATATAVAAAAALEEEQCTRRHSGQREGA